MASFTPFKRHRGARSDCPTCRKLIGLAPKAAKKNYKQKYFSRYKPVSAPEVQQPVAAGLDACTGNVTLY